MKVRTRNKTRLQGEPLERQNEASEPAKHLTKRTLGGARMSEVAELAGVSRMTVSRSLNEPEKVKDELRERVLSAVRELGYVQNHLARSFSSQRSNAIGLILPNLGNTIFSQTVKGVSDYLRERGAHLMLAESGHDVHDEERAIGAFLAQRVGGLILHSSEHTQATLRMLETTNVPVVEMGDLSKRPVDMVVSFSNFDAAKAMTMHFAERGYRSITLASLNKNPVVTERQRGFLAALDELGIDPHGRMITVTRGVGGGAEAISYLAEHAPKTDALFCASDVSAVGAILECVRRKWPVPERMAIASFNDLEILRYLTPTVTCLNLPRYEIGKRSAELLWARMEGEEVADKMHDLGFEIMHRAST
jgi:LacI family gluconate utilization system Gnt-I transcriptional repressor